MKAKGDKGARGSTGAAKGSRRRATLSNLVWHGEQ